MHAPRVARSKSLVSSAQILYKSSRVKICAAIKVSPAFLKAVGCGVKPRAAVRKTAKYFFFQKAQEGRQNLSGKGFVEGNPRRGFPCTAHAGRVVSPSVFCLTAKATSLVRGRKSLVYFVRTFYKFSRTAPRRAGFANQRKKRMQNCTRFFLRKTPL